MKLFAFKAEGFGGLGRLSFDFGGKSAVVYGRNEEGKTTFADALLAKICGIPGGNRPEARIFKARYGAAPGRVEAEVRPSPVAGDLFKSLLVLRRGECPLTLERGFMPEFTRRVMGGGAVDIREAIERLEGIVSTKANAKWMRKKASLADEVRRLSERLCGAQGLLEDSRRMDSLQGELEGLGREIARAEARMAAAEAALKAGEEEDLRGLRGRWESARREISGLKAPGEDALSECRSLREKVRAMDASLAEGERNLEGLRESRRALERDISRAGELVKSPGSARGSPSGLPGKPALAAFLLGLAAALGLFAWTRDWRAALPAACVAAAAAFWLLARARAAGALEEEGRRTGEIEGRVKALREERLRKDSGIEALEARLAAVRGERLQASERLDRDLDAWGVRTVDALSDLRSDLALKGEALRAREEELRRALDAPEVPADGIGPLLERRLADLREARAGLEAGPPERSAAEWEAERAAAGRRRGELLDRKDSLSERLREMSLALGERKGGLGGEPCGIFESLQEARRNEEDVDLWREAAAMAARVMREVEGDAESAMRGCLGEAARLFRELTGGAYSDVEMEEGGSIFEPSSLKVRHRGLGAHPLEWMSSGAQDLLWLSLRLTLAARMFPETALLLLDEPFQTQDIGRTGKAVEALFGSPLLEGWQVILLTKDERVAELCARAGAARLDLAGEGR